ncbi:sll0787 family AIR synthase-like protein [Leptolyngbya sp. CCY15150]|uniref:sll0787 family AIR synthase-like protein n=1 Tax=Leptolyngbya sp. CCY15150 TaxID=2767772 RepID=UPI0019512292|nr:sll0787 family AIR synthase-like protein [Leptolyngbya sp. CCY15150]
MDDARQLPRLVEQLRHSLGIQQKQDIQLAAQYFRPGTRSLESLSGAFGGLERSADPPVLLGDDCAAIWQGDRHLLFAAEGMLPSLVEAEPWFAGWCAVMVNVSDIYAMGGHPIAIVDALWSPSPAASQELWTGLQAAAAAYGIPVVGGHTNCHSPYAALSVAILGQAQQLITSFHAQAGDVLLMAIDLRGQPFKHYPFWNAATTTDPQRLRDDLSLLPIVAEQGWCDAGKDISMGGVLGTALMLLETSQCGAVIDLEAIPRPPSLDVYPWLHHFPSYGFLLSVRPHQVERIQAQFHGRDLHCEAIGRVDDSQQLTLTWGAETAMLWNLVEQPLTGWAPSGDR